MHLTRRILLAAAIAMPTSTIVAIGASQAPAFAATTTCTAGGTVTFAAPGISANGTDGGPTAKTTTTTVTGVTLNCTGALSGSGSIATLNIVSKSQKCKGAALPVPACVAKGDYVYDSVAQFAGAGLTLAKQKSIKKLNFTINGVGYSSKTTSATVTTCGSEPGFLLTGSLLSPKALKGTPTSTTACLGADTGPGTTGSFGTDLGTATIATAQIDPTTSTVSIG